MTAYADLELGLHRWAARVEAYAVEIRFSDPTSESDMRIGPAEECEATFDFDKLRSLSHNADAYGAELTASLFRDPTVRSKFTAAMAVADTQEVPLRIRLVMEDPALLGLHWETLLDPQDGTTRLAATDNVRFSRYPISSRFDKIQLRAKGELRALVAVANPAQLARYQLAPVDVEGETTRALEALSEVSVVTLPDNGCRATLSAIASELAANDFDIVYLVCHGTIHEGESWLMLDPDDSGQTPVPGADLAARISELSTRPRLVVLASCESAGDATGEALAAVGPQLLNAGVPAVLAMQGRVQVSTIATFMPVFFAQLLGDGEIDRAVASARRTVLDRPDHWMPALFMRIESGRIWYVPGFSFGTDEFEKWKDLRAQIRDGRCTPILGPSLSDRAIASRGDIAQWWADQHRYPLGSADRDVLYRVAQYVATTQSPALLPKEHRTALRETLLARFGNAIAADLREEGWWSDRQLKDALDSAIAAYADCEPDNPYLRLARLRLPLYIVTSPFDLMSSALRVEGLRPVVRVCPWNDLIAKADVIYEAEPSEDEPLVYHLYGRLGVAHSVVYSEDDFFDYLIGVTRNRELIPDDVVARLTDTSLLFLGSQLEDREFRVLFRFIMAQEGRELLRSYTHVAAQLEPTEDILIDHQRAQRFLEQYFDKENVDTYWGTAEDFLDSLATHV